MHPFSKFWIISVFVLLASFAHIPSTWADVCGCKVTSLSGSTNYKAAECTLYKVVFDGCANIEIDASTVKDGKAHSINLTEMIMVTGVTIKGPALSDGITPGVTLTFDPSSNFPDAALVQLKGNSTLTMLGISAPGKTAVQMIGSGNSVVNVAINKSAIGFQLDGNGGTSQDTIKDSIITGATVAGAKITGTSYTLSNNQFISNKTAIQLTPTASKDIFDQNTFTGNTVGIDLAGGNSNLPAPQFIRAIHPKGDMGHVTLVAIGIGAGSVTAYLADGASSPQGMKKIGNSDLITSSGFGFWLGDFYKIDVSGVPVDADIVLISNQPDLGSSPFSTKIKLSSKLDEAPIFCLTVHWFQEIMMKLNSSGSTQSVWAANLDGDEYSTAAEDKNQDCVISTDPALNESDPSCGKNGTSTIPGAICVPEMADVDKDGVTDAKDNCPNAANPDQKDSNGNGVGDACDNTDDNDGVVASKDNCPTVSNTDQADSDGNGVGDACEDTDGDGVLDPKDNCPTVPNLDQKDFDGDALGDVCDPDMDNDGLTNEQEKVAGTMALSADGDEDGFCDGPAWGPIDPISKQPKCKPGDNCPTVKNGTQWDDDEDGIGNDCDASKWASQGGAVALVDSDADGFYDYTTGNQKLDNCPSIANPDQKDTDGDKIGDACDSDDDNDGLLDVVENSTRYVISGNGAIVYILLNPLSAESDTDPADGKNDSSIDSVDQCPVLPGADKCDVLPGMTLKVILNDDANDDCPTVKNLGIKGAGGKDVACDPDIDGDGIKNADEDKAHTHYWEADSDHYKMPFNMISGFTYDLVKDGQDICPTNFNPGNPQPDVCKASAKPIDTDSDGVPDAKDNCPVVANADQTNMDGDAMGDACDLDIDDDGIPNDADKCAKFNDPSNICKGATPGVVKDPPLPPPAPGINGAMQGGSGCSLVTDATASAQLLPTLAMVLAPLAAFMFRRRRNPE